MTTTRKLSVLSGLLLSILISNAAPPPLDPGDLPKLSNLSFGWVSMSGVDPTQDMITQFAPNMVVMKDAGYKTGGEAVFGGFEFGDFHVNGNFQSAITTVGPGLLRICHYGYSSNMAEMQNVPGIPIQTTGDAIEVSYAQRIDKTVIGVTLIPIDEATVNATLPPLMGSFPVNGTLKEDLGVRIGAIQEISDKWKIGTDVSYQADSSTVTVGPLPVIKNKYQTWTGTAGTSYKLNKRTKVYYSWQKLKVIGGNLKSASSTTKVNEFYGISQQIGDKVTVSANYLTGSPNAIVSWQSPIGIFTASYTHHALLNAKSFLGTGHSLYCGLAVGM
jgi:hypothetical protein